MLDIWTKKAERKYIILEDMSLLLPYGGSVYRIRAIRDFGNVKAGQLGGFVARYNNLSHDGTCWIYDDGIVTDDAEVRDDAKILGNAMLSGCASAEGNAIVRDHARMDTLANISGTAIAGGKSRISGLACVDGEAVIDGNATIGGWAMIGGSIHIGADAIIQNIVLNDGHAAHIPTKAADSVSFAGNVN